MQEHRISKLLTCFLFQGYMNKLGSLKSEMEFTGSLELSFAAWLCGDGAYVVPCSRVAKIHVDRAIEVTIALTVKIDSEGNEHRS